MAATVDSTQYFALVNPGDPNGKTDELGAIRQELLDGLTFAVVQVETDEQT